MATNENQNDPSVDTNQFGDAPKRLTIPPDSLMTVSSPPHIKGGETTTTIMADVLIALLPALVWGVYIFGPRALVIVFISVFSCVLFEFLFCLVAKKRSTIKDLSAAVTGVLLAFGLPVNVPLWAPVLGAAFAIIIVKQLFGGIGKNIVNPAIAARVFLSLSFGFMSRYQDISLTEKLPAFEINLKVSLDAIAGATPLAELKQGMTPDLGFFNMFLGEMGGCIGEISAICLLVGGLYLMWRKVISWHTPISYIAVIALVALFLPKDTSDNLNFALGHLLSGGLFLGAFFMATDYATSPITKSGKLIFGAGCGLLTIFIRYFGAYPEGVSFSIMVMNLFVWYIDKATKPVKFGGAQDARK
ncbi:MAG: RnfABCDGE type electron transport complex subunit D [Oscillospiraceae bacterium]|nr:RnfABCDGE type electron transport complex subunit D [Oscillospiraceae bacterium]